MSYVENLKTVMDKYESKICVYNDMIDSDWYNTIKATAAFEFILGLHICELLECYNNNDAVKMKFTSAQDAAATYLRIVEFRKKKNDVLDSADKVMQVKNLADEVNELVASNPYLPRTLCIDYDRNLGDLAERCIETLPKYDALLSKKFRNRFTEFCIESLPNEELDQLVAAKVIQAKNLDMISPTGSDVYEQRLRHVCALLGRESIAIAEYNHKLKGVSFANEDGTNRQDILKEIDEAVKRGEKIELTAEQYTYVPDVGDSEPAIKVLWKDKTIGNISRSVVKDILDKTDSPISIVVDFESLTGGGSVTYGCDVNVEVYAIVKTSEAEMVR